VTVDGTRYLAMTHQRVARPFHLRWLMPAICGTDLAAWTILSRLAVVALAPLAWIYTGSPWAAACIFLPGVWFSWRHPVTVDGPAMFVTLAAACLWPVCWPLALALCFVAACVKETAPIWVAVFAWTPVPLIALAAVAARALLVPAGTDPTPFADLLAHPFASARAAHRERFTFAELVAPWGGLLLGLAALDARAVAALALGYGQLLVATDTTRLYQWAWPALAACAFSGRLDGVWGVLVAVAIIANPALGSEADA
jgi:hypothetical protein